MTDRTGKCLCGAVTFAARNVPAPFAACHCKMCQRWAGSAFMGVTVQEGDIEWAGEENIKRLQTTQWAERAWCDTCGSGLWYRVTAEGPLAGSYEIPVGLFDDMDGLHLVQEIFVDRKSDAFAFAGDHERLTEAQAIAKYSLTDKGSDQ